ncbi:hypothetical protein CBOM_05411 [Ceraceosorus bombacis]|uniref:Uncharacterized protein n=1 Tax=Ceraceosorus bombacis TaxID=401625 RepID=A0A0P1BRB7_9BASI|nr:hypothetical protein CBOM_05411 [Ceraceosorus bombacis]
MYWPARSSTSSTGNFVIPPSTSHVITSPTPDQTTSQTRWPPPQLQSQTERPATARLSSLQIADQWAVKSLNFAESKVPYPFHATYNDLYSAARYPADQTLQLIHAYAAAINKAYDERILSPAKSVYSSRVAPYVQAAEKNFQDLQAQNAYVARAVELTQGLVNNLQQQVNTIQSGSRAQADAASKKAQATSQAIFAELDRVRSFAQALPAESRKRFDPALQTFTDAYETLRREALDSKVPAQERLNRIVAYVREQTIPALQKSLSNGSAPQANGVAK